MINNESWATDNDVPTPEKIPQPVGYRILIRPRGITEKTKGGIILTDSIKDGQSYLNSVGKILAMGNECYSDSRRTRGRCTFKSIRKTTATTRRNFY